jgi:hypothetical protein
VTFAHPSDFELIITGQELGAYWTNQLAAADMPLLRV